MLPRWSRDSREIFDLSKTTPRCIRYGSMQKEVLRPSRPETLFTTQLQVGRGYPYDVAPDGRFLAVVASGSTTAAADPGRRLAVRTQTLILIRSTCGSVGLASMTIISGDQPTSDRDHSRHVREPATPSPRASQHQ